MFRRASTRSRLIALAAIASLSLLLSFTPSSAAADPSSPTTEVYSITSVLPFYCTSGCTSPADRQPPPPILVLVQTATLALGFDGSSAWGTATTTAHINADNTTDCANVEMSLHTDTWISGWQFFAPTIVLPLDSDHGSDVVTGGCSATQAMAHTESLPGPIDTHVDSVHDSTVTNLQYQDTNGMWHTYAAQPQTIEMRCSGIVDGFFGVTRGGCSIDLPGTH